MGLAWPELKGKMRGLFDGKTAGAAALRLRATACLFVFVLLVMPASAAPRQFLQGHVPAAVANLQPVDILPGPTRLSLDIGLPMRNQDDFNKLLEEIYDPASTNFHRFVTPQQFTAQFGPDAADYQAVIHFAEANGLTVTKTFADHTLLTVSGTVADIEKAFQLHMRQYPHPTENRRFFAPDAEPSLDLGTPILGIGGLNNFVVPRPMNLQPLSALPPGARPASVPTTGSGPGGFLLGSDFRNAYAPGVTLTGTGQSVGLFELDGYFTNDITAYKNLAGLPDVLVTNVLVGGYNGAAGSNNVEVALDIEMAISMAPGLNSVMVYEGTSVDAILTQMLSDNVAKQVSASWTYPVDMLTTNLFQRMGAAGISFFNASGDSCAYPTGSSPLSPTDDPFITVVGGTSLTTATHGASYVSETVWNWFTEGISPPGGSSGGSSLVVHIPTWQKGINMTTNLGSTTRRNLPDVALTGDAIWVTVNNGSAGWVAGTSCASPLWAAFTALVNQRSIANGGTNLGFLNPALYAIGKGTNFPGAFHDITTGNNTNLSSTKFPAVTGYDLTTGWGTPNGANMIYALSPGPPLIPVQPSNQVSNVGSNATFSVTAVGGSTVFYQWQFGGSNLPLATNSTLTLTNLQPANQGIYAVMVSNLLGSVTSSNATLTVDIPPAITTQPQNVTVPQGSNATFTVVATGAPAPTYRWKFNGTNIFLATSTSYTVTNAQPANRGIYTVVVTNPGGGANSSNAVLTVLVPPGITTQPVSQTVNQGDPAGFSVIASGSPLSYQWLLAGSSILGATNSSLALPNAQATDAGNYSVVITNQLGSVTSSVVTLTVNLPPGILSQPQGLSLVVGNNASFAVTAAGTGSLGYQWFFNSVALADNGHLSGSQSPNLSLTNLHASDAGNYQVIITNVAGSATSFVAVLAVSKATPVITWTNPAAITYGTVLDSNQLNAVADQPGAFAYSPAAGAVLDSGSNLLSAIFTPTNTSDFNSVTSSVYVYVLRAPLSLVASDAARSYGQTNPVFNVSLVGVTNGDPFTASATSIATATSPPGDYPIVPVVSDPNNRLTNYNLASSNGTLSITIAPAPIILGLTPNTSDTNGGIAVTISGTGFLDGATVNFGATPSASVVVTNSTNIIAIAPPSGLGLVDVVLTNVDGQSAVFSNAFTYTVTPTGPQITFQPTNQAAVIGSNIIFAVTVTGTDPLNYQWAFNQTNLASGTNLNLDVSNIQPADAGPYQLVVTNLYGAATSSVVTLSVLGVPVSFVSGGAQYSNGKFSLQLIGLTGQGPVVIQASSNLTDWSPIFTNPPGFGQFQFTDTNASNLPYGFYRAVVPAAP